MGYRDNFYVAGNIIGFTGKLHESPTVYFQAGIQYGHITQNHWFDANCGREEVGSHQDYRIGNEGGVSVERCGGHIIHTSRSSFTAVQQIDLDSIAILAQSITGFTEKKQFSLYTSLIFSFEGDEQEQVLEGLEMRQHANALIRAGLPRLRHVTPAMMSGAVI